MSAVENVKVISVVRDFPLYRRCVEDNPNLQDVEKVCLDNREGNEPVPVRYNAFLDGYDHSRPAWLVFCHEDFEIAEPVRPLLNGLDRETLHGPIGCSRQSFLGLGRQIYSGCIEECDRGDESHRWMVGRRVPKGTEVETFDCCCLIVHSDLVKRFSLRFDEALAFDLYVEDFCAMSKVRHGIASNVLPLSAIHHSGSVPTERLTRHLPYLRRKYPRNCFAATCTYFGTMPFVMRVQRKLMGRSV